MTILDEAPPETRELERESTHDFGARPGRSEETLEKLQALQAEERRYLQSIELNGGTGRAVEFLRAEVEAHALKIAELKAKLKGAVA